MEEDIFLQISNTIRNLRKEKHITIQHLADKAGVSKGLVSQVENSRTVPSLPVLLNLIKSLDLDLNEFFSNVNLCDAGRDKKVILKKKEDYATFEKEKVRGFHYLRLLTTRIDDLHYDFVLLTLKKGARRKAELTTNAFEYKYLIEGKICYHIDGNDYFMESGDSIYFDARQPHAPENVGDVPAVMLVVYIFNEDHH